MTDRMNERGLNRATLARQYLLDRVAAPAVDAVEQLAGMQSQAPLAPYIGLWTRLRDFDTHELSTLTAQRQVVRLHLMRDTVHLVSARDCLDWRALFEPLRASHFTTYSRGGADGVDRRALLRQAGDLLEQRPSTRAELAARLAALWPDADPEELVHIVAHHIAMCQTPPRGLWGSGGPARWAPVAAWLGAPLQSVPVDGLILRYLGAFGPATVADIQLWSGLTRLREVVEQLSLRTFVGPNGQTLHDLPEAARPDADTPAPPRFLPAYDNLLLSHKDRGRVITNGRPVPLPAGNGATTGTFLIDGIWAGTWQVRDGQLHVQPFDALRAVDRDDLLAEALRLAAFLDPQSDREPILDPPNG
jgi:Winged helix DNA-binding domain